MKNVLSVLTIVGCLFVSVNAMAADPLSLPAGSNAKALKHNEEGMALYHARKFEDALKHFDASEGLERSAQVYFNEGLTYDQLGKAAKARMHFQEAQRLEQKHAMRQLDSPISKAEVLRKYQLMHKYSCIRFMVEWNRTRSVSHQNQEGISDRFLLSMKEDELP
jgi:tetratricopeptide (TPR) repeat protein